MSESDVVIAGGGLTGLALAAGLGSAGLAVTVIEQERHATMLAEPFDGRVTAVALASQRLLARFGVWPLVGADAEPILDIEVGESGLPPRVHYHHRDIGPEPFGWIAENRVIRTALVRRVAELPSVRVVQGRTVSGVAVEADRVTVEAGEGAGHTGRLLLVAEGRQGSTRDLLGIGSETWDYHQKGLVCTLAHEQEHHGVAIERFFPDGPFAMLPMTGNRTSIVWALADELADEITRLDDLAFLGEVAERFDGRLGELELVGPRFAYPLRMVMAERIIASRAALVGDAARGVHPIAGQGWNLGLRDVEAIVELVTERFRLGLDIGDAALLETYASRRRLDGITMVAVTDGINRLFANDLFPLRLMREAGLAAVERLPPLKRLFMRHAMGTLTEPGSTRRRPAAPRRG